MTRQEVAEIVHGMPSGMDADDYLVELVSRAILREREACAKVCEGWTDADGDRCAEAIRSRGIDLAKVGEVGVWGEK